MATSVPHPGAPTRRPWIQRRRLRATAGVLILPQLFSDIPMDIYLTACGIGLLVAEPWLTAAAGSGPLWIEPPAQAAPA